jgi:hypothetical protein
VAIAGAAARSGGVFDAAAGQSGFVDSRRSFEFRAAGGNLSERCRGGKKIGAKRGGLAR